MSDIANDFDSGFAPRCVSMLMQVSVPEGDLCAKLSDGHGFRCGRLVSAHDPRVVSYRCDLLRKPLESNRTGNLVKVYKPAECLAMRAAP